MRITKSVQSVVAVVVLVAGSLCARTRSDAAVVISVNFSGLTQSLAPGDMAGVVQASNWNNAPGSSGANQPLVDSTGAPTGALISYISTDYRDGSDFGNNPWAAGWSPLVVPNTPDPGTNQIYRGSLVGWNDDGPHEVTITLSNIPFALYDVYVYAGTNSIYGGSTNVSDGTTSYYYSAPGDEVAPNSLTQNFGSVVAYDTYAVFSAQTGSTFNLSTGAGFAYSPNEVFGLQIVPNAASVPEPTTIAVWAISLLGIALGSKHLHKLAA